LNAPPPPSPLTAHLERLTDRLVALFDRLEGALPWARIFWLALGALLTASFVYEDTPVADSVWCLTRRITGNPCPGCGLTRSFCAMARADIGVAFQAHLAGPMLYLATLYGFALPILRRVLPSQTNWSLTTGRSSRRFVTGYWAMVVCLYVAQTGRALMEWIPA